MTSEAPSGALEDERRRQELVATADRVFATLLDEVELLRRRRTAALRPLGMVPGGRPGGPPDPAPAPADAPTGSRDGRPAPSEPPVALVGRPGESVATCLWVHNLGAASVSALALQLTVLTSDDGAAIAASHGTLRPDRVHVGSRASAEVHVTVAVPGDAVPGVYHGYVRGEGLPVASAVPVRLVVRP
jgi:hypothetical protein